MVALENNEQDGYENQSNEDESEINNKEIKATCSTEKEDKEKDSLKRRPT